MGREGSLQQLAMIDEGTTRRELTVMRRVFDGGEGLIKGGTAERSRDSGVLVPRDPGLEGDEFGGELVSIAIASARLSYYYYVIISQ